MTISEIIKAVRFCIDEEAINSSETLEPTNYDFDVSDNTLMDNLIRSKIGHALIWVLLNADSDLLTADNSSSVVENLTNVTPTTIPGGGHSIYSLPSNFVKIVRVRMSTWSRAVRNPIEEDSEQYLQLTDDYAKATAERPMAALIRTSPMAIELWPGEGTLSMSYVKLPSTTDYSSSAASTDVSVPTRVQGGFIYYIAYLVLAAYRDASASVMLDIAKANITKV